MPRPLLDDPNCHLHVFLTPLHRRIGTVTALHWAICICHCTARLYYLLCNAVWLYYWGLLLGNYRHWSLTCVVSRHIGLVWNSGLDKTVQSRHSLFSCASTTVTHSLTHCWLTAGSLVAHHSLLHSLTHSPHNAPLALLPPVPPLPRVPPPHHPIHHPTHLHPHTPTHSLIHFHSHSHYHTSANILLPSYSLTHNNQYSNGYNSSGFVGSGMW
jgi:hypothetical protein